MLTGTIPVRGAKNHALKVFPAALLCKDALTVTNVPDIEDIAREVELLEDLGFSVVNTRTREYIIHPPKKIVKKELYSLVAERFRASIAFVGPLLARTGEVAFPFPGGCVLGKRPIDFFLDGWCKMGARVRETKKGLTITAPKEGLQGIDYTFRFVSVGATEGLMMTAILARGRTILRNASIEPEVTALTEFLISCGARIEGAGTSTLSIEGRAGTLLSGGKTEIIPDRIETGSFAILAGLIGRSVTITDCNPAHVSVLIAHLRAAGVSITEKKNSLTISRAKKIMPVDVRTREYPGFATDHQAPFTVFLTQATGVSMVHETVFDGRLFYTNDVNRMGAHIIQCDLHRAIVFGPTLLHGRVMESPDLRAGIAFVIAALIAKGESRIGNLYHIDRGYEALDERLRAIGADIRRV